MYFQLIHGVQKVFCGNLVYLVGHGFLNIFNCIKPCTLQLQLHLREQELVGGDKSGAYGGGSMLRLVFGSETVELLLPNAPGHCRAEEKITISSNLLLKSAEPQFSGCQVYLLLTEMSLFNLL
jgi:hypothetical protein